MALKAVEKVQKKYKEEDLFVFFPLNWEVQKVVDEEILKQIREQGIW